jgi:hypothetical protein
METQLTQLEQGAISAEHARLRIAKCYAYMLEMVQNENIKDPYTQLQVTISQNSLFNIFKIYFKDEIKELGLNTELEYSKKPEK